MLAYDRRLEPRVGERVPYVVVYGMPGVPLIQLVRRPLEVLQDAGLRLNSAYYISKQILPPLDRVFALIGVDVFDWYRQLPRVSNPRASRVGTLKGKWHLSFFFFLLLVAIALRVFFFLFLTQTLVISSTPPVNALKILSFKEPHGLLFFLRAATTTPFSSSYQHR